MKMENFLAEYSKFLNETNKHLSLQSLATYINLPGQLSDKEKQFISNHLVDCKECSNSFNLIFDEDLELDGKKNVITLFRQLEGADDDLALFKSKEGLVEVEMEKIDSSDFNLRFLSLPSRLKNERAALKMNSVYILRILEMDTGTIFIVKSERDLINIDSLELVSLTAPTKIPVITKNEELESSSKFYWYAAAAMIVIASAIFLYYANKSGNELQNQTEPTKIITGLTPGQKPMSDYDTAKIKTPQPVKGDNEQTNEQPQNLFAANMTLENFIDRNERGDSQIQIVSPSVGAEVKMPVTFKWEAVNNNMTLHFVILTNHNNSVYEKLISGKGLTIDTKLQPGLYYWKLESAKSVEAMGKFFIR
jgi:hypothetical protein